LMSRWVPCVHSVASSLTSYIEILDPIRRSKQAAGTYPNPSRRVTHPHACLPLALSIVKLGQLSQYCQKELQWPISKSRRGRPKAKFASTHAQAARCVQRDISDVSTDTTDPDTRSTLFQASSFTTHPTTPKKVSQPARPAAALLHPTARRGRLCCSIHRRSRPLSQQHDPRPHQVGIRGCGPSFPPPTTPSPSSCSW
jgi:hypothetical protein